MYLALFRLRLLSNSQEFSDFLAISLSDVFLCALFITNTSHDEVDIKYCYQLQPELYTLKVVLRTFHAVINFSSHSFLVCFLQRRAEWFRNSFYQSIHLSYLYLCFVFAIVFLKIFHVIKTNRNCMKERSDLRSGAGFHIRTFPFESMFYRAYKMTTADGFSLPFAFIITVVLPPCDRLFEY